MDNVKKSKIYLLFFLNISLLFILFPIHAYAKTSTTPSTTSETPATSENFFLITDFNDLEIDTTTPSIENEYADMFSIDADFSNFEPQPTTPVTSDQSTSLTNPDYSFDPNDDPDLKKIEAQAQAAQINYAQTETESTTTITNTQMATPTEATTNTGTLELPLNTELKIPKLLTDKMPFIPQGAKNYLKSLTIKNMTVTLITTSFGEDMMIAGTVHQNNAVVKMSDGRPLKIILAIISKSEIHPGGTICMVELPDSWRLSQFKPELSKFDHITFKNPILVVSSFAFTHKKAGYSVEPGLNIVAEIEPTSIMDSSLYNLFTNANKQAITKNIVQAVLTNEKKSFFKMSIQGQNFKKSGITINNFLKSAAQLNIPGFTTANFTQLNIPQEIAPQFTNLTNFALINPKIELKIGMNTIGQTIALSGTATIFGKNAQIECTIERKTHAETTTEQAQTTQPAAQNNTPTQADQSASSTPSNTLMETAYRLFVKLPQGWSFADTIPALQNKINIKFENPYFILSSNDSETLQIKKGLNFKSIVQVAQLPTNPLFNVFKKALNTLVDKLIISGVIASEINKSEFKLIIPATNKKMFYIHPNIIDADTLLVPQAIKNDLKKIALQKPELEINIKADAQSGALKGAASFNGALVDIKVFLQVDSTGKLETSITLIMPAQWTLSDIIPELPQIDGIKMHNTRLILSSFDYTDPELEIDIKTGANIHADTELSGVFDPVQKFYNTILKKSATAGQNFKITTQKDGNIQFDAIIPPNIKNAQFGLVLPIDIFASFESIPGARNVISSIEIKKLLVKVVPGSQEITAGSTVSVKFPFENEPIETTTQIGFQPGALVIESQLKAFNPKFFNWLELHNSGFKIVLAGEVPTQIELYGGMTLNNKDIQVVLAVGKEGNAISAHVDELSTASMIELMGKIIGRPIPIGNVPQFGLKNVDIHLAPEESMTVNGKKTQGGQIKGEINILGMQGIIDCSLNLPLASQGPMETWGIIGIATLSPLTNNPFLTISGTGQAAAGSGPALNLTITPAKQQLIINGKVGFNIPGLNIGINQLVDITLSGKKADFTLAGSILGFDAQFDFSGAGDISMLTVNDFNVGITLAQSATEKLKTVFVQGANVIKQNADRDLNAAQNSINTQKQNLQNQLNTAKKECGL